jgi:hypothetical protein
LNLALLSSSQFAGCILHLQLLTSIARHGRCAKGWATTGCLLLLSLLLLLM